MFEKEALTPNGGQVWTPEGETPFDIHPYLVREIDKVVQSVQRHKIIVIRDTEVNNRYWSGIPTERGGKAHTDALDSGRPIEVHVLHSPDGKRYNTDYKFSKDLKETAKKLLPAFLDEIKDISQETLEEYRINDFIESIEHPEIPYLEPERIGHPIMRVERNLERLVYGNHRGFFVSRPQRSQEELAEILEIEKLLKALNKFDLDISRGTSGYSHSWQDNPGSTVLAYQGDRLKYTERSGERILHHRNAPAKWGIAETALLRSFITGNDRNQYRLLADELQSRSFWNY